MTVGRSLSALVAGTILGGLPFWQYASAVRSGAPHADHEPRHGGQLGMVGDHHVELVRGGRGVEVYVSDAWRRAVRPEQAWVALDHGPLRPLRRDGERLTSAAPADLRAVDVVAILSDGTRLEIAFGLAD